MALGGSNVTIDVEARLNTGPVARRLKELEKQGGTVQLKLDDKGFRQPLGRITGDLGEFQNALDASIARTLAFGAAVGVVNSLANGFKAMVQASLEVEKKLKDINVILNQTQSGLRSFSDGLFEAAKNTGQSFEAVADAAVELSRQGLGAEDTLKRINDAMILTRLSGMDAAKSVEALTAAINGFGSAALSTTDIVNKLAAVDAAFAVSTEDLANALSRAGATAQAAKVSLDELLAAVTSVQQQTARGGAVIGNAFKSIFTRIQRSGVREALEKIGVSTTDAAGNIRNALSILQDYATVYKTLSDGQRAYTDELIAGVFQINNLRALVKDLGSGFSIYDRALSQSSNATDEAIRRNEELKTTFSSLLNEATVNAKKLAASLGDLVATPAIENLLKAFNTIAESLTSALDPEKGNKLVQGFFKTIGSFISGPGLIIIGAGFIKLFKFISKQVVTAAGEVFKIGTAAEKNKKIEAQIGHILANNRNLYEAIAHESLTHSEREQKILDFLKKQNTLYKQQESIVARLAKSSAVGGQLKGLSGQNKAGGFIPNFTKSVEGGIAAERDSIRAGVGGASASAKPKVLRGFPVGGGRRETMVANTDEVIVPRFGGGQGSAIFNKDMVDRFGMPEGAKNVAGGFIPNFVLNWAGKGNLNLKKPKLPTPVDYNNSIYTEVQNFRPQQFATARELANEVVSQGKAKGKGSEFNATLSNSANPKRAQSKQLQTQLEAAEEAKFAPQGAYRFWQNWVTPDNPTSRFRSDLDPGREGKDFDKKLHAYLGTKDSGGNPPMDWGKKAGVLLPADLKKRKEIGMQSGYSRGDAHVSLGHEQAYFFNKILRDTGLFKYFKTKVETGQDSDFTSLSKKFVDIIGVGSDDTKNIDLEYSEFFKQAAKERYHTSHSTEFKNLRDGYLKARSLPSKKGEKLADEGRIKFDYIRDAVNKTKVMGSAGGFIPNFAKKVMKKYTEGQFVGDPKFLEKSYLTGYYKPDRKYKWPQVDGLEVIGKDGKQVPYAKDKKVRKRGWQNVANTIQKSLEKKQMDPKKKKKAYKLVQKASEESIVKAVELMGESLGGFIGPVIGPAVGKFFEWKHNKTAENLLNWIDEYADEGRDLRAREKGKSAKESVYDLGRATEGETNNIRFNDAYHKMVAEKAPRKLKIVGNRKQPLQLPKRGASGFIPNFATTPTSKGDLSTRELAFIKGGGTLKSGISMDSFSEAEQAKLRAVKSPSQLAKEKKQAEKEATTIPVDVSDQVTMLVATRGLKGQAYDNILKREGDKWRVQYPIRGLNANIPVAEREITDGIEAEMLNMANSAARSLVGPGLAGGILTQERLANQGAVSGAAGSIFETALQAIQGHKIAVDDDSERNFDIVGSPNKNLSSLFGGYSTGLAEVKITDNDRLRVDVADKIIRQFGPQKKREFERTAAGGFIPNFQDMRSRAEKIRDVLADPANKNIKFNQKGKGDIALRQAIERQFKKEYDTEGMSRQQLDEIISGLLKSYQKDATGYGVGGRASSRYLTYGRLPNQIRISRFKVDNPTGIGYARGFIPNFASSDDQIVPQGTAENAKKLSIDLSHLVIKLTKLQKDSSINLDEAGASVGIRGAAGFIPSFAGALEEAVVREKDALQSQGSNAGVYIDQDNRLKGGQNPMGLLVANTRDEPLSGSQGVDRVLATGRNPKSAGKAAEGYIPSFAKDPMAHLKASTIEDPLAHLRSSAVEAGQAVTALSNNVNSAGSSADSTAAANAKVAASAEKAEEALNKQANETQEVGEQSKSTFGQMIAIQIGLSAVEQGLHAFGVAAEDFNLRITQASLAAAELGSDALGGLSNKMKKQGGIIGKLGGALGKSIPVLQGLTVAGGLLYDVYDSGMLKAFGIYNREKELNKERTKESAAIKKQSAEIARNIEAIDKFGQSATQLQNALAKGDFKAAGKFYQSTLENIGNLQNVDIGEAFAALGPGVDLSETVQSFKDLEARSKGVSEFSTTLLDASVKAYETKKSLEEVGVDFEALGSKLTQGLSGKQLDALTSKIEQLNGTSGAAGVKLIQLEGALGTKFSPALTKLLIEQEGVSAKILRTVTAQAKYKNATESLTAAFEAAGLRVENINDKINKFALAMQVAASSSEAAANTLREIGGIVAQSNLADIQASKTVGGEALAKGTAGADIANTFQAAAEKQQAALGKFVADLAANGPQNAVIEGELKTLVENAEAGTITAEEMAKSLLRIQAEGGEAAEKATSTLQALQAINQEAVSSAAIRKAQMEAQLRQLEISAIAAQRNTALSESQINGLSALSSAIKKDGTAKSSLEKLSEISAGIKLVESLGGEGNILLAALKEETAQGTQLENLKEAFAEISGGGISGASSFEELDIQIKDFITSNSFGELTRESRAIFSGLVDAFHTGKESIEKAGIATAEDIQSAAVIERDLSARSSLQEEMSRIVSSGIGSRTETSPETTRALNEAVGGTDGGLADIAKDLAAASAANKTAMDAITKQQELVAASVQEAMARVSTSLKDPTARLETAAKALQAAADKISPNSSASGFIPSFSPKGEAVSRAIKTEQALGGRPVLDKHPAIGPYVRDGKTQPNFAAVKRDHPEGLTKAVQNSAVLQGARANGFVPNLYGAHGGSHVGASSTALIKEQSRRISQASISKEDRKLAMGQVLTAMPGIAKSLGEKLKFADEGGGSFLLNSAPEFFDEPKVITSIGRFNSQVAAAGRQAFNFYLDGLEPLWPDIDDVTRVLGSYDEAVNLFGASGEKIKPEVLSIYGVDSAIASEKFGENVYLQGRGSRKMKSTSEAAKEFLDNPVPETIRSAASRGPSLGEDMEERMVKLVKKAAESLKYSKAAGINPIHFDEYVKGNPSYSLDADVATPALSRYVAGKTALTTLGNWFVNNRRNPIFKVPLDFTKVPTGDGEGVKLPKFFSSDGNYTTAAKMQAWSLGELKEAQGALTEIGDNIRTQLAEGDAAGATPNQIADLKKSQQGISDAQSLINGYVQVFEHAKKRDIYEWISRPRLPGLGGELSEQFDLVNPPLEGGLRFWFYDFLKNPASEKPVFANSLDPTEELLAEQRHLIDLGVPNLEKFLRSRFDQGEIFKVLARIDSGLVKSAASASVGALRGAQGLSEGTSFLGRVGSFARDVALFPQQAALGGAPEAITALAGQAAIEGIINTEDAELEIEQATELTKERDRYYLALLGKQAEDIRATDPAQEVAKKIKFLDEKRKGYDPYISRILANREAVAAQTKKSLEFEQKSKLGSAGTREKVLSERLTQRLAVIDALKQRQALYNTEAGLAHLYFADTSSPTEVNGERLASSIWDSSPNYLQQFSDLKKKYFLDQTLSEIESAKASGGSSPSDVLKEFGDVPSPGGRGWITFAEIRNLKGNPKGDRFRQFFEQASPEERIKIMQGIGARPVDPKNLPEGVVPKAENVKNSLLNASQSIPFQFLLHEIFDARPFERGSPETEKLLDTIKSIGLPYNDTEPLANFLKTTKFPITSKLLLNQSVDALPAEDVSSILKYITEFQINDWMEANNKALQSEGGPLSNLNELLGQVQGAELNKFPVYWDWKLKNGFETSSLVAYFNKILDNEKNWSDPEGWKKKYSEDGLKLLGNTDYGEPKPNKALQDKINTAKGALPFLLDQNDKSIFAKNIFGNPNPPTFKEALKNVMGETIGFSTNEEFDKFISNTAHPFPDLKITTDGRTDVVKNLAFSEIDNSTKRPRVPAFAPYGYRYSTREGLKRQSPEGIVGSVGSLFELINAEGLLKDKGGKAQGFIPNFSAVAAEIAASHSAGYKSPVTPSQVKTMNIPGVGKTAYNTQESVFKLPGMSQPFIRPPANSKAAGGYAKEVKSKFNFNPYAKGFVPNLASNQIDVGKFDRAIGSFSQTVNTLDEVISQMGQGSEAAAKILENAGNSFQAGVQQLNDQNSDIDFSPVTTAVSNLSQNLSTLSNSLATPLSINSEALEGALTAAAGAFANIGGSIDVNVSVDVNVDGGDIAAALSDAPDLGQQIQDQVTSEIKSNLPTWTTEAINKGFVT